MASQNDSVDLMYLNVTIVFSLHTDSPPMILLSYKDIPICCFTLHTILTNPEPAAQRRISLAFYNLGIGLVSFKAYIPFF